MPCVLSILLLQVQLGLQLPDLRKVPLDFLLLHLVRIGELLLQLLDFLLVLERIYPYLLLHFERHQLHSLLLLSQGLLQDCAFALSLGEHFVLLLLERLTHLLLEIVQLTLEYEFLLSLLIDLALFALGGLVSCGAPGPQVTESHFFVLDYLLELIKLVFIISDFR